MSTIKSSAENLTLNADGANNDVIIQSNGSTLVTVDGSASSVGIGTTTPDTTLNVAGNIRGEANSTPTLQLKRTGNAAGNGYIECLGSDDSVDYAIRFAQTANVLSFDNGGSRIMGVTTDGLTFGSDTAAANALDDYEEGTFTPTIGFGGGGNTGITYSVNAGSYTKIGNLVTWYAKITLTSKGSSTGYAQIRDLPFSCNGTNYGGGTMYYSTNWNTAIENDENFQFVTDIGNAYLTLRTLNTDGDGANILDSDFDNNTQILIGGNFQV